MERDAKLAELAWLQSKKDDEWDELVSYTSLAPNQIQNPPWKLPENHEHAAIVNQIMEQSLKVQSATIPNRKQFYSRTHFILSNACQNVSILLKHYLQAVGVESKVVYGILNVSEPGILVASPHVFLKIGDHIVDNTYSHNDEDQDAQDNLDYFIEMTAMIRQLKNYVEETPSKSKLKLVGGEAAKLEWNYIEVGCRTELNQKKLVAAVMKTAVTNQGTWIYDKLMRIYLKREFNVEIEAVENEMLKICWNCGQEEEGLKTCSGCQIAKYCDKNCISDDWKIMHKMMHKMITKGNKCALNMH